MSASGNTRKSSQNMPLLLLPPPIACLITFCFEARYMPNKDSDFSTPAAPFDGRFGFEAGVKEEESEVVKSNKRCSSRTHSATIPHHGSSTVLNTRLFSGAEFKRDGVIVSCFFEAALLSPSSLIVRSAGIT